jgi:hypothetical protein
VHARAGSRAVKKLEKNSEMMDPRRLEIDLFDSLFFFNPSSLISELSVQIQYTHSRKRVGRASTPTSVAATAGVKGKLKRAPGPRTEAPSLSSAPVLVQLCCHRPVLSPTRRSLSLPPCPV